MHPFYNNVSYNTGELVFAMENDAPPTVTNPTGRAIPAWNEAFTCVGSIPPETCLVVLEQSVSNTPHGKRQGMYICVLSPELGKVWVQNKDVVKLNFAHKP